MPTLFGNGWWSKFSVNTSVVAWKPLRDVFLAQLQVWTQGQQWKGWIMCAKQLVPDSFQALLQLPTQQFGAALAEMSNGVKLQLSQYAKAPSCPVAVPRTTLVLLQEVESSVAAANAQSTQIDIASNPAVNSITRTPSTDPEGQV